MPYGLLADAVLIVHFGVIVFNVGGLAAIVIGNWLGWRWVNDRRFRIAHVVAIGYVVVQAWLGRICPLTTLESWLRGKAGESGYATSFIEHWIGRLIFFDAPLWAFAVAYTLFGLLVAVAWWRYPPRRRTRDT